MDWNSFARLESREAGAFGESNRKVLQYWQSLRTGSGLPSRTDFSPARIAASLPRIMVVQVWPHERIACRLAGTEIVQKTGVDLTGADFVANSPPAFRRERLRRFSNCFSGFAHRSRRRLHNRAGASIDCELLILPFAEKREDGSSIALIATDWATTHRDDRLAPSVSAFVAPEFGQYLAI